MAYPLLGHDYGFNMQCLVPGSCLANIGGFISDIINDAVDLIGR